MTDCPKLVVGITGASGSIYGLRLLETLKSTVIETHAIVSKPGLRTLNHEVGLGATDIDDLADATYNIAEIGAAPASGSFKAMGMIVAPCSMKTMAEISLGITGNLIARAADVMLKERRKLVLAVRETPLHVGHLRNMTRLAEMGAIIAPPVPGFYAKPENLDDMVDHTVGRLLDLFAVETGLVNRWEGL